MQSVDDVIHDSLVESYKHAPAGLDADFDARQLAYEARPATHRVNHAVTADNPRVSLELPTVGLAESISYHDTRKPSTAASGTKYALLTCSRESRSSS